MNYIFIGLSVIIVGGVASIVWKLFFSKSDTEIDSDNLADLTSELKIVKTDLDKVNLNLSKEQSAKDRIEGEKDEIYKSNIQLQSELKTLRTEGGNMAKQITTSQSNKEMDEKKINKLIDDLTQSKTAFEEEKSRIRREDVEKMEEKEQQRDRLWSEHEGRVIKSLADLCSMPRHAFTFFDNNSLPEDMPSGFKPDFMLKFLDQYVIFDAKASRSDNFNNYIKNSVKSTVAKIKNNPKFNSRVFFVVPSEAISELSETVFYEQGYDFFIVPPESLAPILSSLKQITTYELMEQLNPEDREGIVNLIAELDYHINFRNAADILLATSGAGVLQKMDKLNSDIHRDVFIKKQQMHEKQPRNLSPSDLKDLIAGGAERQDDVIKKLVSPKGVIGDSSLDTSASLKKTKSSKLKGGNGKDN